MHMPVIMCINLRMYTWYIYNCDDGFKGLMSDTIRCIAVQMNKVPIAAVQRASIGVKLDTPAQQPPLELTHDHFECPPLASSPP